MPRAFSSLSRSVSTPVSARTSAVFPWSMCPAVPRITLPNRHLTVGRQHAPEKAQRLERLRDDVVRDEVRDEPQVPAAMRESFRNAALHELGELPTSDRTDTRTCGLFGTRGTPNTPGGEVEASHLTGTEHRAAADTKIELRGESERRRDRPEARQDRAGEVVGLGAVQAVERRLESLEEAGIAVPAPRARARARPQRTPRRSEARRC